MGLTPTDFAKRTNTPPLQGRGKGWGIPAEKLAELKKRARKMRNDPTEPEKRLWRHLSRGQLGGFKFRRQEIIGWAIADFYCPFAKLVIEVDGDTHSDAAKEARRDQYLEAFGLQFLHISNDDVMHNMGGVLEAILMVLMGADAPHPNPSPKEEGLNCAFHLKGVRDE